MASQTEPPSDELQFGFTPRQLNLAAVRLQALFASRYESLATIRASMNVAQDETQTMDVPIEEMSSPGLVAFLLQIISANNAALSDQLREAGLIPLQSAEVPGMNL